MKNIKEVVAYPNSSISWKLQNADVIILDLSAVEWSNPDNNVDVVPVHFLVGPNGAIGGSRTEKEFYLKFTLIVFAKRASIKKL